MTSNLNMMLSFPIRVESHNRTRDMSRPRHPCRGVSILKSYTISIRFENTTIHMDIPDDDPRYQIIKDHLQITGCDL